uniref:Uncharacterized protein n=1 Tax=mine drainage metagenome TaxID=410659 RepID=E6Q063_9ZZZZ
MLYLIGCDHRNAQTYREGSTLADPENRGHAELMDLIQAAAARYHPLLIAEEANADVLRNARRRSVVYDTADEIGIPHRFCEPTWDEKGDLSIEEELPFLGPGSPFEWKALIPSLDAAYRHDIAHRWPVREKFWIDSLGDDLNHNVLFICGAAHRWTLRRRLEAKGIGVRIIAKRVGAQPLAQSFFAAYRDVRRRGFAPATGCFCISPISDNSSAVS